MKRNNKGQFLKGSFVGYVPWNKGGTSWSKGKKLSKEHIQKLKDSHKGKKLPEETKKKMLGRVPWNKGKKGLYKLNLTKEQRIQRSIASKGERGNNWQGGKSKINHLIRGGIEFRLWREAVFARDNWTCQMCKGRNGNGKTFYLHAHHIKYFSEYPELRTSIENGITLCKECHKEIHKKRSVELNPNQ